MAVMSSSVAVVDNLDTEINAYLTRYAATLTNFDAHAAASLWGTPGLILDDRIAGAAASRDEMVTGLEQGYPLYRKLGLASVDHEYLGCEQVTDSVIIVRVRWLFYDADGHQLTDGTNIYILRRDDDELHAYVCIATDEAEKIQALAAARGVDLTGQPG